MNKKKHIILKALYNKWQVSENYSGNGIKITELGKSLTSTEIQKETNININEIEQISSILINDSYVKLFAENLDDKVKRYLILESGKKAYLEKTILNRIWFRNSDFWKFTLPFLVGLLGLLNSIFNWFSVNN